MLGQPVGVGNPTNAQRPPEGAAPQGKRETSRIWMQMCAPTRQPAVRIGSEAKTSLVTDRDDPQQLLDRRALPAAHTGAHRRRTSYH